MITDGNEENRRLEDSSAAVKALAMYLVGEEVPLRVFIPLVRKMYVQAAIVKAKGNITGGCKLIGIHRNTAERILTLEERVNAVARGKNGRGL